MGVGVAESVEMLNKWLAQADRPVRSRRHVAPVPGGLRFAFYGRTSSTRLQEPANSRRWQLESARDLIAGHGQIVAEFFDIGYSRRLGLAHRPEAADLLSAVADPDRGFDAIVVGEYERAFYGQQLHRLLPILRQHSVPLWLPETAGPVDPTDPSHWALLMALGAQSRREVLRARFRTTNAMRTQTREQGRYLGGRPPYGYRLVDAGPHPNRQHSAWGRRLHRLEPDPATAPTVTWIFAQRLTGQSMAGIARALNETEVACPSAMDRARNPHRTRNEWTLRSVAAILANPRYTGRQVWNRQRRDHDQPASDPSPVLPDLDSLGRVQRWNTPDQWVISKQPAHPALVSEADFVAAQHASAIPTPADDTVRRYQLVGLLRCGHCGRRLEAHWVHGRAGYRCRHGATSANRSRRAGVKTLYLREDNLIQQIRASLSDDPPEPTEKLDEHLRNSQLEVICTEKTCTLETPRRHAEHLGPAIGNQRRSTAA